MYVVKELWGLGCPSGPTPWAFPLGKRREVPWLLATGWISELRSKHIKLVQTWALPVLPGPSQGLAGRFSGLCRTFCPASAGLPDSL